MYTYIHTYMQVYYDALARLKGKQYEAGQTHACLSLTMEEFEEYYRNVGQDLDDEYFAAMMIQAWRLHKRPIGFMPAQVICVYVCMYVYVCVCVCVLQCCTPGDCTIGPLA
jgi:hypothetical protein